MSMASSSRKRLSAPRAVEARLSSPELCSGAASCSRALRAAARVLASALLRVAAPREGRSGSWESRDLSIGAKQLGVAEQRSLRSWEKCERL